MRDPMLAKRTLEVEPAHLVSGKPDWRRLVPVVQPIRDVWIDPL